MRLAGVTVPIVAQYQLSLYIAITVSSQLVTWPTRNQVNPYPGSPLVTTFEKSTRNQSLGYELTFHKFWRKLVPKHIPYQDIYDYTNILFYI